MGGKHLKRMRAEKSKVHLKKKKLAKGQNVTDTTFKVKKILTIEQLKKVDDNEPVSNFNITLKDLLIRLSHYNVTSRLNGLTGIKEILSKSPEILMGPSLKPLISKLLELVTDEEHKIRITTMDLVSYVLSLLPQNLIEPFHDILNVHLACAMTHRNTSVQQDSLKFIDVIIKHSPKALKHNLKMITQNFLRIIKNVLYGSQTGMSSVKEPRQELETSKTEMLLRFHGFLEACYSKTDVKESDLRNFDTNVFEKQEISLREFCACYKTIPDLSDLFKNSESKGKVHKESDPAELKTLCSLVMPLLFDIWTEFSPNMISKGMASECILTGAIGELLCVLLKIMLVLNDSITALQDPQMEHWFTSNFKQPFKKFTLNFPYFPSVQKKKSKSGSHTQIQKEGRNMYLLQNLIICYLSYSFKVIHERNLEAKMEEYISNALMMKNPAEIDILIKVIEVAINYSKSKKSNILNAMMVAYKTTTNSGLQQSLSKALSKIALEGNENSSQQDLNFRNWTLSLPHHLCESHIFVHEIETILKLIMKPTGTEVLKELELKAEEIAQNLPHIKIEGVNEFEGQRMIASILYRCNDEVLQKIIEKYVLQSKTYSDSLKNFVLETFYQKLNRQLELY